MRSCCAPNTGPDEAADKVADLLRFLAPSFIEFDGADRCATTSARYHHMGALLADTALQASVNYNSVVKPRVDAILMRYPDAVTVRTFIRVLENISAADLLKWRHPEKPRRFVELLTTCAEVGVESVIDLADWITISGAEERLRNIKGIGPKSVDYLRMLAGQAAVPMDRHLFRIVLMAGVTTKDYSVAQRAFVDGSLRAGLCVSYAERAVWHLMSTCSKNHSTN